MIYMGRGMARRRKASKDESGVKRKAGRLLSVRIFVYGLPAQASSMEGEMHISEGGCEKR